MGHCKILKMAKVFSTDCTSRLQSQHLPSSLGLQLSYMVLDLGITPVTFSVGNTMKRVAVVVSAVLFFKNPVSPLNWVSSLEAASYLGWWLCLGG
jgi:hypothetical protein